MNTVVILSILTIASCSLMLVYENNKLFHSYILDFQEYKHSYYYAEGALSYAVCYYNDNKDDMVLPGERFFTYGPLREKIHITLEESDASSEQNTIKIKLANQKMPVMAESLKVKKSASLNPKNLSSYTASCTLTDNGQLRIHSWNIDVCNAKN